MSIHWGRKVRSALVAAAITVGAVALPLTANAQSTEVHPAREFGPAADAVWGAYRQLIPREGQPARPGPARTVVYDFLKNTPATNFHPPNLPSD
jgi:hypothetical protein